MRYFREDTIYKYFVKLGTCWIFRGQEGQLTLQVYYNNQVPIGILEKNGTILLL